VYHELHRRPYLALNPKSLAKPFEKSFKKPNALSLASESVSDLVPNLNLNLSLFLVRWHPPGRSPVCHPHGRIAVPAVPDHYI
jgi:hypothetical protein